MLGTSFSVLIDIAIHVTKLQALFWYSTPFSVSSFCTLVSSFRLVAEETIREDRQNSVTMFCYYFATTSSQRAYATSIISSKDQIHGRLNQPFPIIIPTNDFRCTPSLNGKKRTVKHNGRGGSNLITDTGTGVS